MSRKEILLKIKRLIEEKLQQRAIRSFQLIYSFGNGIHMLMHQQNTTKAKEIITQDDIRRKNRDKN